MKTRNYIRILGVIVLALTALACGGGDVEAIEASEIQLERVAYGPGGSGNAIALTSAEIAGLKYMREEEKLAHDVYVAMSVKWGTPRIFYQISQSETTHTNAVLSLLNRYRIADPAAGLPAGKYADPTLQALYDSLIKAGNVSRIEALKVGALIEETDIRDINLQKANTTKADILRVYNNLLCGSQNHMRSFNRNLLNSGVVYVPQVITQAEWDAIINSSQCVL